MQANETRLFRELPDGERAEIESELVEQRNIYREMSLNAEPPSYIQSILERNQLGRPDPACVLSRFLRGKSNPVRRLTPGRKRK